jgi:hypothetical protein
LTFTDTDCHEFATSDVGTGVSIAARARLVSRGTCNTRGGALQIPAPWGTEIHVCAAQAGGGCEEGKICVKQAPPRFEEAVCMSQGGNPSCPAPWDDATLQVYGGEAVDDRACTACTCNIEGASCSGGKVEVSSGRSCAPGSGATATKTVSEPDACVDVGNLAVAGGLQISFRAELGAPGGMTCGTSTPSGSVKPAGEAKICCRRVGP